MEPARGGREKVKELSSKEHQGLKSSGLECNKCEVACTEKGLWPMAWLCFFTLSTHTSGCLRQGNLLCLALLIFRGKGVGGGSRLMRLCQMRLSRGAVDTLCFKSGSGALILTPAVPQTLLVLEGRARVEGPGNRKEGRGIAGCCPQVLLEQPFHPLSKAGRGRVGLKG